MKKLYFIRHGLSELNVASRMAGTTETPLTGEGRRQAKAAGKQIKKLGIDYIVSSPLSRALETAQIIAKEIDYPIKKIHVNKLFIERDLGSLEGTPWSPDLNLDGFSDVETVDSLLERARLALAFLQSRGEDNILVVSHGAFGRALRHHLHSDYPFGHPDRLANATLLQWYG